MSLNNIYQFEAIGTPWSVETQQTVTPQQKQAIQKIIADFDALYSRFRSDSMVSRARQQGAGSYQFSEAIIDLYGTYALLETVTHGAVNPLVGEALEHWGYDASYSLQPAQTKLVKPRSFTQTISQRGTTLVYNAPALLDLGAVGKGCLIDIVAAYVAKHHTQYVVEAGGDMRIATNQPYVVGLEDPAKLGEVIGMLSLQNKSICASSPNRRSWGEGLHHIIDARTGKPATTDIAATWAIAKSALLADALTTALFFVPAADLQKIWGDFEYIVMKQDGRVQHNIVT